MLWGIHKTEKRGLSTSEWLILLLFAIYQCSYLAISFCTLFLHHQKLSGANNLEVRIYVPHWDILSTHKSCERDQNPRGMLHWLGFQSGNQTVELDALGQSIGWAHAVKLNLKGVNWWQLRWNNHPRALELGETNSVRRDTCNTFEIEAHDNYKI